ncbi:MAG TPA: hypothetical protein VHW23_20510 [Kofleriaceae bacterium]|jgi:hypothetical protein|nr:hypothetical protein [Kofleriaceae bacterium]
MNKLLALGLSLPMVACVVGPGSDTPEPGGGSGGSNTGSGGTGTSSANHISSNTTWSGAMDVTAETTVDQGVTLTIAAGTTVKFGPAGALVVNGTVDVQGTKDSVVNLVPATTGMHFGSTAVEAGGVLTMNYAVQTGGGFRVDGGKLTVTNTRMSQAEGDFLVVGDGTVDVSYSAIGLEPGAGADTTHCDMHFGGSGASIKVTHSNISTSSYGLMLYGGNNVDLTFNNWFNNPIQIDTTAGVSADISNGWFDKGAPSPSGGATLTYNSPAANRLPVNMAGPQ